MPKVRIMVGPSPARTLVSERVGGTRFRTTRIQTLPRNEFTVRGKPSRRFSMNMNYAKVVTNEVKAKDFDKKERYLPKSKRKKLGVLSKVIIRTHNNEYSKRIEQQDSLRRQNDRLTKTIKWALIKLLKRAEHSETPGSRFVDYHYPKNSTGIPEELTRIRGLIHDWAEQAKKYYPGEAWFLEKGPNNIARKLALKRMGFIGNNGSVLFKYVEMLADNKIITLDEQVAMLTEVDNALSIGYSMQRQAKQKIGKKR